MRARAGDGRVVWIVPIDPRAAAAVPAIARARVAARSRGGAPHHVGLITALHGNGLATVVSGNDGRCVRERVMSIADAVVCMPG
jgi:hypothetical protein